MEENKITKGTDSIQPVKKPDKQETYMEIQYSIDPETGKGACKGINLSDGTIRSSKNDQKFREAAERASGNADLAVALTLVGYMAEGMPSATLQARLNELLRLLPSLEPKNEIEAILLSQFLTLSTAGQAALRRFHDSGDPHHAERFGNIASKLFAQANASMAALLKRRAQDCPATQIVHLYNDQGQAIVAQHLVAPPGPKNPGIEPHG